MPEGPSLIILKEACQTFIGKKVVKASGSTKKLDIKKLEGKKIVDFKTWGKHFLICFPDFTVRIHLLMFGTYRINERKETPARLALQFTKGELNFYTCAVELIEKPLNDVYDWSVDVMNPLWDPRKAMKHLKENATEMVCDVLLNQKIFSGVGNIIKNEVLFRIKVHPQSITGHLPLGRRRELIREAVHYSFQFLEWKMEFTLAKHWLAHEKKVCPRDHVPYQKAYLGKTKRRSYFCTLCQKLY
jgi:endonuclease-8